MSQDPAIPQQFDVGDFVFTTRSTPLRESDRVLSDGLLGTVYKVDNNTGLVAVMFLPLGIFWVSADALAHQTPKAEPVGEHKAPNKPIDDTRLDGLLEFARKATDGFVNSVITRGELRSILTELKRLRDRPLHCPCCDGDHL